MAELVVLTGARAGAVFDLPEIPTVVGRSPEAHFRLDDPWISSMHAMFERRGSELWVVDLESRNGTFLGDERVQEALVQPGTLLRFGKTEVRVERSAARRRTPPPTPPSAAPVPPSRPTSRLDAPDLRGAHTAAAGDARAAVETLPLAPRPVALLRLSLHVPPELPIPDADHVRAAVETLLRVALAEGGLVLRHGCGILAVFGAADPSRDDVDFALRAARAALAGVEHLGGGFTLRAALDHGTVLLGNIGGPDRAELAALGEMAERMERILAVAAPGEILAGQGASGLAGLEAATWMQVGGEEIRVARVGRR